MFYIKLRSNNEHLIRQYCPGNVWWSTQAVLTKTGYVLYYKLKEMRWALQREPPVTPQLIVHANDFR